MGLARSRTDVPRVQEREDRAQGKDVVVLVERHRGSDILDPEDKEYSESKSGLG